ncbi:MAG: hypothetical protein AAGI27_03485 [Pseudomonadota bacterium]
MKSVNSLLSAAALLTLTACGNDASVAESVDINGEMPEVTFKAEQLADLVAKKHTPIRISYRFVGEPVLGKAMTVDLRFASMAGDAPVFVSFGIPDTTALEMPQDQLREVAVAPGALDGLEERFASHQVTVIPRREGRIYLNVAAEVETADGTMSTVTAIPLQVGNGPRTLRENGTVVETESGELVRSLPAKQ